MTGYGRGQAQLGQGTITVELRSLNSRFLDLHLRLPPIMSVLEEPLSRHISRFFSRGRVNVYVSLSALGRPVPKLVLNRPLLEQYQKIAVELRAELDLSGPLELTPLLLNRELVVPEEPEVAEQELWEALEPAVNQALEQALAMRSSEGQRLAQDMLARLEHLEQLLEELEQRAPEIVEAYRNRLNERIGELMGEVPVDAQRIAQEVAIMADKCDITEEIVRARSHIAQFRSFLEREEPVGRRLDFLLQELNREANTIGAKSPDARVAQIVVELKSEIERLREQAQNVE